MKKYTLYWILALLFGGYVALRAFMLSFTIDEAMSYNYVVGLWGEEMNIANNHFLNTQLMRLSHAVFGSSPIALRLPNVLSFFLYAWSALQLLKSAKSAKSTWLFYAGAVLLLALPFPLEFFALARGYGLSMAFTFFAIAHLLKAISKEGPVHFTYASIGAGLAVLSNNAVLNASLVLWAIIVAGFVLQWKSIRPSSKLVHFALSAIVAISCFAFSLNELLELRALGELFFGTDSYASFGDHLISNFLYTDAAIPLMKPLTLVPLMVFVVLGLFRIMQIKTFHPLFIISSLLLLVSLFGWVIEHEFFGALLPRTRTAIIYVPLISLWIFSIAVTLQKEKGAWGVMLHYHVFTIAIMWMLNFALLSNLTHARDWKYSAKMDELMTLAGEIAMRQPNPIEIEKPALYRSNINYYIHSRPYPIVIDWKEGVSFTKELVLAKPQDVNDVILREYTVVFDYSEYETVLLVRKDVLNQR